MKGPSAELEPLPWSRPERIAVVLFVCAMFAGLLVFVHTWFDPMSDAVIYIATAKSLLAGEGYSYLGDPFILRPPGFTLLLAPILAFAGTDFHLLNLCVALFGVAALVLAYLFWRPRLGPVLALCVAAMVWSNPAWQRRCSQSQRMETKVGDEGG